MREQIREAGGVFARGSGRLRDQELSAAHPHADAYQTWTAFKLQASGFSKYQRAEIFDGLHDCKLSRQCFRVHGTRGNVSC